MDRFQKLNMVLSIVTLFVCIVLVKGQADDFPGPYCATRPGGCCKGRKDACAVPISSKFYSQCVMHSRYAGYLKLVSFKQLHFVIAMTFVVVL